MPDFPRLMNPGVMEVLRDCPLRDFFHRVLARHDRVKIHLPFVR